MSTYQIPWACWYSKEKLDIHFPDDWNVSLCEMKGGPDIGEEAIRQAIAEPIGSPPLRDLAKNRRSAAILVDDLSRPTPAFRLLPHVIEELAAGGISEENVTIIGAVAAHRPMIREDFVMKIGADLVDRMRVVSHYAYGNLDFLGHSSRGVPVFINRDFMACELRIAIGMISPRGGFFGGGSKLVLPGAAGHTTILANHRYIHEGFREHLDEVGRMAGLNFIVNPMLNADLDVIGLVAGHPEKAYWEGVETAKDLYATKLPESVDIAVFNAFPKDNELMQASMATVPIRSGPNTLIKDDTTIVIMSAAPEGLGYHTIYGPGCELSSVPGKPRHGTIVFSPNVNRYDALSKFGDGVEFCRSWEEVVAALKKRHNTGSKVALFPAGSIQYGVA